MFKKLIVTAVIIATATTAMARDITVTFANGSQHRYQNTPDSVTPEQIIARVAQDFPAQRLTNIDGGSRPEQGAKPTEEGIDLGRAALTVLGVVLVGAAVYYGIDAIKHAGASKAYPCMLPTDRAKDGSLCGGRASSVRPGGR
jgi:hypothetical protein